MNEPLRRLDMPVEDPPDQLERLRAGDPDAIRDALREVMPAVRRHLYRLLGPSADIDDATQDVLTKLARFLPRFEGRAKLDTVAYRITVRVAYDYFKPAREVSLEVVPDPVDPDDLESRVMAREALARLHRCISKLGAKRRIAFVLCAIDELTPTEAARVAGTTALAIRCRLLYARRELARMLEDDPYLSRWLRREEDAP